MNSLNTHKKLKTVNKLKHGVLQNLAKMAAKISLKYNINLNAFIEYYKSYLVKLAKTTNPAYSIVELSCRTGIDRRYINHYLNLENVPIKYPKSSLVLNEIKRVCSKNNTQYIYKHGPFQSFDSVCESVVPGALTPSSIAKELIRLGNLIDKGDKYQLAVFSYMPEKNSTEQQFRILTTELNRLTNTVIYNFDQSENQNKQFQRNIYSTQINPNNFKEIKEECTEILSQAKNNVEKIILQYEENVPADTYPTFGASLFIFGYESRQEEDTKS
jgi:hypothetical protein